MSLSSIFLGFRSSHAQQNQRKPGNCFLVTIVQLASVQRNVLPTKWELNIVDLTFKSIVGVTQFLNPFIRGWVNYYGRFRKHEMNSIFQLLRKRLTRWARRRYKRYKTSVYRAYIWLEKVQVQFPALFYHWQIGLSN
jgi:hypothetical protein